MSDHLTIAAKAARKAGEMLKANFGAVSKVERKADRSLVTNLDKEAERIIVNDLLSAFPSYGIIGEESGKSDADEKYTWVIDPLDGTHNYIRGIPVYGVSIGLMLGNEFVAGVIYMPTEDELYTAERGGGSWKNGKRIRVSSFSPLLECSLSYDSDLVRSGAGNKMSCLKDLASKVFNIRMSGSSVRNLTFCAEGKVDAVIEFDDHIWDFAAGVTLVREAGGKITDHRGGSPDRNRGCYIATNGHIHDAIINIIAENS
ncbi:MAG: inositol monophosphatase [Chitinispirillaceae bacterium]|jgi:myo-inositol-1(or 4)-monophosphatase